MICDHVQATGSEHGQWILDHFAEMKSSFKKIIPRDYRRMLERIHGLQQQGFSEEEARLRAFEQMTKGGDA